MSIAVGGEDLVDVAFAGGDEFQNGNIEGAPTEIVYGDVAALLFVEAVGQGRGGRFVDQAQDFETGDLSGVFGGLALRVIEVGRDRDHGPIDLVPQVALGRFLQLAKDVSR